MIFEGGQNNSVQVLDSQEQAVDLIKNVEVPVCLNLALCYLKTSQPHHAIKYASQMLDKKFSPSQLNNGVATLEKAYYRRGSAYLMVGDLARAKTDLVEANRLNSKNPAVIAALKEIKDKQQANKKREQEMTKRMFASNESEK